MRRFNSKNNGTGLVLIVLLVIMGIVLVVGGIIPAVGYIILKSINIFLTNPIMISYIKCWLIGAALGIVLGRITRD